MEQDVEATGARFRRWSTAPNRPDRRPENDPYRDWECKNPRQLFARLLEEQFAGPLRAYASDVGAAIAEHRPDLVVCSQFAFGAMVAAETEGVPFDVMLPNVYLFPFEGSTPVGMGLRPRSGAVGRTRDRLVKAMTHRTWDKGLARLNGLRTEGGLKPLDTLLGPAAPGPPAVGVDVDGLRLPGANAACQRALRRSRARRSATGRRMTRPTGHPRPVTTPWCSLVCPRRSRITSPRCNGSSTPWLRCRCAAS